MIGKTVSHFHIISKLGEGGMGVVYKAEDLTLGRTVALKFLPTGSQATEQDRSRLIHEARAAAALLHPNICPIYEVSECEGRAFIAMAYIEGKTLRDRIAEGALPLEEALSIARQVGEALGAAHEREVIHRDVKPANVMLTPEGRAILMDFGLAKVSGRTKLTVTGTTMGTLAYMSPEQVQGAAVDHRADLWALGVVLYEMVAGRPPFRDEYEAALLYSIVNSEPEVLSGKGRVDSGGKEVPVGLDGVIQRALAKDPARRYQGAREFVADLGVLAQDRGALPAGRAVPVRGLRRVWRRWRVWERVGAVGAVSLLAAVLIWGGYKFWPGRVEVIDSIAVLPLTNLSGELAQDVLAAGVTEQLSSCIGTIGSLRVISDQSMRQFKGSVDPLPLIGRKVGAKALLTGSIVLMGGRVQLTVKLYDAARDRMLWTNTYDRDMRDILAVQNEIALAVASQVKAELTPQNRARLVSARPVNPDAYDAYIAGLNHLTPGEEETAAGYFRRAIENDPEFAPAYAGLAECYTYLAILDECLYSPEQKAEAANAAKRALALDENLAEAHAASALVRLNFDWDWSAAEAEFKRAFELNPNSLRTMFAYRFFLTCAGRYDEAISLAHRAAAL